MYIVVRVHLSRLNGEHTEHMCSKHLSVYSIFRQTAQKFIYTISIHRYIFCLEMK